MRRRIGFALVAWLLLAVPARAQILPPTGQFISVIDSGVACSVNHACATWSIGSSPTVAMQITGTFTGTLTFEGSADNLTWFTIALVNLATGGLATTTATTGQFTLVNTGIVGVRARATAAVTGGANITLTRGTAMSASKAPAPAGGAIAGTTGVFSGNLSPQTQVLCADGTALLPCYSFTSEPTLGFWRSAAATITAQATTLQLTGSLTYAGNINGGISSLIAWASRARLGSPADGNLTVTNNAISAGSQFKVDALPVYATGFGATTPAVVAGSTPFAGAINVGTGAISATGTITFGGTAFPSTPFCQCNSTVAAGACSADGTSATVLTLTTAVAPVASSLIRWLCVSSK